MWAYNKTDELYHYGVLGMKWGVRKASYEESKKLKKQKHEKGDTVSKGKTFIRKFMKKFKANLKQEVLNSLGLTSLSSQMSIQQANNFAMQETTRSAINASLQASSLSMSGGTNPFMFGMM